MRPPFLAPLAKKAEGRLNPNLQTTHDSFILGMNNLQAQANYTVSNVSPSVSYTGNTLRNNT